jgi:hypothetical protein
MCTLLLQTLLSNFTYNQSIRRVENSITSLTEPRRMAKILASFRLNFLFKLSDKCPDHILYNGPQSLPCCFKFVRPIH